MLVPSAISFQDGPNVLKKNQNMISAVSNNISLARGPDVAKP